MAKDSPCTCRGGENDGPGIGPLPEPGVDDHAERVRDQRGSRSSTHAGQRPAWLRRSRTVCSSPNHLAMLTRPVVVGLVPPPSHPRGQTAPASPRCCDSAAVQDFHLHPVQQRLVALDVGDPQLVRTARREVAFDEASRDGVWQNASPLPPTP